MEKNSLFYFIRDHFLAREGNISFAFSLLQLGKKSHVATVRESWRHTIICALILILARGKLSKKN
jgi:hypothetical protein